MVANAFELLGLEARLSLDEAELREAFREAGKKLHPDAGGDPADFERLRAAVETLSSPGRRLIHWLECHGRKVDTRGTVDTRLMDLFGVVGEATRRAAEIARKRSTARSALALAMLEGGTQECLESLESAIRQVDGEIDRECGLFPAIESGGIDDPETMARCARNLLFLEKWRATLRAAVPSLM